MSDYFFQTPVVKKTMTSFGPGKLNDDGDMTFLLEREKRRRPTAMLMSENEVQARKYLSRKVSGKCFFFM